MGSQVTDLQTGQKSKPWFISYSHGRKRAPVVQSISHSEEQSVESYGEFDNDENVASVRSFNGAKATVEWLASDNKHIEAMMMDTNPEATQILYDPSKLRPIDILVQDTGRNSGEKYIARLWCHGQKDAGAESEDTKSAMKKSAGFSFLRYKEVINGDIQYSRFVNTPSYATSEDIAFVAQNGTFATNTVEVETTGGTMLRVLHARLNGAPVTDSTLYAATQTTFTPVATVVAGDIWEVYSAIAKS